jgi:hypothetical protein
MRVKRTNCNGCPECVGCGRKFEEWSYHECDICGSLEQLYIYDGKEICADCLLKEFEEVDMEE